MLDSCKSAEAAPSSSPAQSLSRMAKGEPDPETAASVWDEVLFSMDKDQAAWMRSQDDRVSLELPTRGSALYERGNSLIKLRRFKVSVLTMFSSFVPCFLLTSRFP